MSRILKRDGEILITVPYARKARLERPFHRIYDDTTLEEMIKDLVIRKRQYAKYVNTSNGDFWKTCSKSESQDGGIVLLKLSKG